MKKILVLGLSDNRGGVETFFYNFYKTNNLKKNHFDFATVCNTIAFAGEYRKDGAKIFQLPNFIKSPVKYYRRICQILKSENYDEVYINMLSRANVLPIIAAKKERINKVIVHSHSGGMCGHPIKKMLHYLNRCCLNDKKVVKIACSNNAAMWLFGTTQDVEILSNVVDKDKFTFNKSSRDKIRKKYELSQKDFVVGTVGLLSKEKNQRFLLKVLAEISDKDIKLMIVGGENQKEKNKILQMAKKYRLENRIVLTGAVEDPEKYYSAFDVFVLPSLFEGQPIALLEAITNGLECAVSDRVYHLQEFSDCTFLSIRNVHEWTEYITKIKDKRARVDTKRKKDKMIAKKIHYCWFGGKELSDLAKRCIESWKKYCPGYEIVRWDESNFDFSSNKFAKEAYEAKNWAFVSDYARLRILYEYGGIYMDTDMELLAPIDKFLDNEVFSGFESDTGIAVGILGCCEKSLFVKDFLDYYNDEKNMHYDSTKQETIVAVMTNLCEKYGFQLNNTTQVIKDIAIYASDVFYPKSPSTRKTNYTDNTVAIHHYSGSWLSEHQRKRILLRDRLYGRYGQRLGWFLYQTVYFPYRFYMHCQDGDFGQVVRKILKRG